MALPINRDDFISYCLRQLGAPVLKIELDTDQIEDRIDQALHFFQRNHFNGSDTIYLPFQVTPDLKAKKYITLPDGVISVYRTLPLGMTSNSLFTTDFILAADALWNSIHGNGMLQYSMLMSYRSMIQDLTSGIKPIRFNVHQKRCFIDMDWSRVENGSFIVLEAAVALDPLDFEEIWTDAWLREYATLLLKQQWGINLKKYQNVQLAGGITLDGQTIYTEATERIREMEDKIISDYQLPIDMMVG